MGGISKGFQAYHLHFRGNSPKSSDAFINETPAEVWPRPHPLGPQQLHPTFLASSVQVSRVRLNPCREFPPLYCLLGTGNGS